MYVSTYTILYIMILILIRFFLHYICKYSNVCLVSIKINRSHTITDVGNMRICIETLRGKQVIAHIRTFIFYFCPKLLIYAINRNNNVSYGEIRITLYDALSY